MEVVSRDRDPIEEGVGRGDAVALPVVCGQTALVA
jgi:hypothetical protein